MAKTSVSDWSTTPGDNTDLNGIPINGAVTTPSQVDNLFREMMAQLKTVFAVTYDPQGLQTDAFARANHTGTQTVKTLSDAGVLSGFRNKIINGGFPCNQRGSASYGYTLTSSNYTVDRWKFQHSATAGSVSIVPTSTAPGVAGLPEEVSTYLRIAGSGLTSDANGYAMLYQYIEGVRTLAARKATLTFHARCATSTRKLGTSLTQGFGSGGSTAVIFGALVHSLTTSWQKFSATIDVPTLAGKTIGSNNTLSLMFHLVSKGTQQIAYGFSESIPDLGGNEVEITQISLVEGDATGEDNPFSSRHPHQELEMCQRYFEVLDYSASSLAMAAQGNASHSTTCFVDVDYKVEKRATPTASGYTLNNVSAPTVFASKGRIRFGGTATGNATVTGAVIIDAEF